MDISILERFGVEPAPKHADSCALAQPGDPVIVLAPHEQSAALQLAMDEIARAHASEVRLVRERQAAERERDAARQAADEQAESARAAQRDACLRGFAIVRAAFEAWRDGDQGVPTADPDVFLALQATHLGFQALARALEKKCASHLSVLTR